MLHKFTALILSCLMLVVATTNGVGLRFCLCKKTLFTGDCPCVHVVPPSNPSPSDFQSGCCSCCAEESVSADLVVVEVKEPTPCNDCVVDLDLGFDQCVPQSGLDFKVADSVQTTLVFAVKGARFEGDLLSRFNSAVRAIPPPCLAATSVPVYLRNQVFLI